MFHHTYQRLHFLYLAVAQHQHAQRPQSSESVAADVAQVVSSQLQQPGAVRDSPGNVLEASAAAVHQFGVLVTVALM